MSTYDVLQTRYSLHRSGVTLSSLHSLHASIRFDDYGVRPRFPWSGRRTPTSAAQFSTSERTRTRGCIGHRGHRYSAGPRHAAHFFSPTHSTGSSGPEGPRPTRRDTAASLRRSKSNDDRAPTTYATVARGTLVLEWRAWRG